MPSLRDYRDRIKSVKSTKKITSAMKMVAASKLRRAQEQAEASQPYAQAMEAMLTRVAANIQVGPGSSKLLAGTGSDQKQLLVIVTADRGLCGGFNSNLYRMARQKVLSLMNEGKEVSIICIGRKGMDLARREFVASIMKSFTGFTGKKVIEYSDAHTATDFILEKFEAGEFDVCTLVYNEFHSVLIQKPMLQQVIPFSLPEASEDDAEEEKVEDGASSPYDFEPDEEKILNDLLPKNIGVQVFRALLETSAGEHAARMTAMDNATRNAGDMIDDLSLQYNRARQAYITKELIEIISGAEAL
ncbi:F0F1 ATP synthase subunit gamma [Alphaproteobacteria bacterium]|nr:F0F1 ATP synthase subunit gamma [Alphaproteobacteria bacterium]